jgi:hypothetical protein
MKVWNNSWYSADLNEKAIFTGPVIVTELTKFFSGRFYGEAVNEILYVEVCVEPRYNKNFNELLKYSSRTKKIQLSVELDYNVALKLDNHSFLLYLADGYLRRSRDIEQLKVKKFNLTKYILDLESFFEENEAR